MAFDVLHLLETLIHGLRVRAIRPVPFCYLSLRNLRRSQADSALALKFQKPSHCRIFFGPEIRLGDAANHVVIQISRLHPAISPKTYAGTALAAPMQQS
jgi:hypothetical protein